MRGACVAEGQGCRGGERQGEPADAAERVRTQKQRLQRGRRDVDEPAAAECGGGERVQVRERTRAEAAVVAPDVEPRHDSSEGKQPQSSSPKIHFSVRSRRLGHVGYAGHIGERRGSIRETRPLGVQPIADERRHRGHPEADQGPRHQDVVHDGERRRRRRGRPPLARQDADPPHVRLEFGAAGDAAAGGGSEAPAARRQRRVAKQVLLEPRAQRAGDVREQGAADALPLEVNAARGIRAVNSRNVSYAKAKWVVIASAKFPNPKFLVCSSHPIVRLLSARISTEGHKCFRICNLRHA